MSQNAQVRNAIKATMETVTDIGAVHTFERYAKQNSDLEALYVYQSQIRGWYIRRISQSEKSPGLGRYVVTTRWRIRGYMSLNDAAQSELAFDDLVEAIGDAFRADDSLGGVVDTCTIEKQQAGIQVDDAGPVLFAGVLCHSAQLGLTTIHYL